MEKFFNQSKKDVEPDLLNSNKILFQKRKHSNEDQARFTVK